MDHLRFYSVDFLSEVGTPYSSKTLMAKATILQFPFNWFPQRVGAIWTGCHLRFRNCFHSISFPSEWGRKQGIVITVTHGLKRPDSIRIQTIDGKQLQGKLVKSDRMVDLALLEVNGSLPAVQLGEMSHPGDSVRSIGYPYGKRASKELQVITAAETAGQITVTAGLSPGDSGGGLFNQSGQLVGINRTIDSRSGVGTVIFIPQDSGVDQ